LKFLDWLAFEAREVDMDSPGVAKTIEKRIAEFCASLDAKLPAYSYIP
jgi:hypothetical protein